VVVQGGGPLNDPPGGRILWGSLPGSLGGGPPLGPPGGLPRGVPGGLSPGGPVSLWCGQKGLEFDPSSDPLVEGAWIDCVQLGNR